MRSTHSARPSPLSASFDDDFAIRADPGRAGYHGTSAALEFGVKSLELSDIIVLGHAHCGGIQALIEMTDGESPPGEFIGPWMSIAEQAALQAKEESNGEDRAVKTEQAVVRMSLKNLMTFPWVADRVTSGSLTIHGFYFDIRDGSVMWLNANTDQFENFA